MWVVCVLLECYICMYSCSYNCLYRIIQTRVHTVHTLAVNSYLRTHIVTYGCMCIHIYTVYVCTYVCTCTNYVVVKDTCLHMKTFILCEKSVLRHTVCIASAVYCAHTHYCGVLFYQFQICKLSICDIRICFPSTVGCVCCGRNKHFELQTFGDSQYLLLTRMAHVRTCTCSYICREQTLLPPVDITGIIHALLENITTS